MQRNPEQLSVAYLNTVYCTDGHSLGGFAKTHWHHLRRQDHRIEEFADPKIVVPFVDETDADVVVLAEILGDRQREAVKDALRQRGYTHAHHGQGQKLSGKDGYEDRYDEILIASKHRLRPIHLPEIRQSRAREHGHGGGLAAVSIPSVGCNLFAGHLPLAKRSRRESYEEQIGILADAARDTRGKCRIALGDFNKAPDQLRREHPELVEGMALLTPDEPTCSTVTPIRWLYHKCLDHAWGKGVTPENARTVMAQSDHKGLSFSVRPNQ